MNLGACWGCWWCVSHTYTGRLSLPGGITRQPSTPRLVEDFNTDGSTLLLRPSAPVYCCDLDPAALGGVGSPQQAAQQHPAAGGGGAEAAEPALPGFGGSERNMGTAAGVAGIGSRCGYRADGFGPPRHTSSSNSSGSSSNINNINNSNNTAAQAACSGAGGAAQGGAAALKLTVPPAGGAAAAGSGLVTSAATATATPALGTAAPGQFWPNNSSGRVGVGVPKRGMLTGFNTQLAVGPGGLVIGPSATGSGVGLRPRPKSSHTAAVESIARRQAVLQVRQLRACWLRV